MSTKASSRVKQYKVINNTAQIVPPATTYGPTSTTVLIQTENCNRTRTGVANPKWRSQILRCENASTDFTASENLGTLIGTKYEKVNKNLPASQTISRSWGYTVPLAADLPTLPPFMSQTKADNIARQKFYKQAIKAQRYLQSGVFIGELRQTLSLIRNPAKSARLLIDVFSKNAIRRARPRKGRSTQLLTSKEKLKYIKNAIADSWLEFSFGWSPLAADVDAAYKLLSDLATKVNRQFAEVKGIGSDYANVLTASALTSTSTNRPYAVLQNKQTHTSVLIKYYGRIRLEVPDLSADRYLTALGLTVADILPTTWELIPWSFFVDYFTNVGDVIEAWSFPVSKLAWASKVVVEEKKGSTLWCYNHPRTVQLAGSGNLVTMEVQRNAFRASGVRRVIRTAVVYVRPPELQFELPFSSMKKSLNIGALMATSRRGIR